MAVLSRVVKLFKVCMDSFDVGRNPAVNHKPYFCFIISAQFIIEGTFTTTFLHSQKFLRDTH